MLGDFWRTLTNIPIETARAKILNRDIEFRPKTVDYLNRQAFVTQVIDKYKDKYALDLVQPYEEMCDGEFCKVSEKGVSITLTQIISLVDMQKRYLTCLTEYYQFLIFLNKINNNVLII